MQIFEHKLVYLQSKRLSWFSVAAGADAVLDKSTIKNNATTRNATIDEFMTRERDREDGHRN